MTRVARAASIVGLLGWGLSQTMAAQAADPEKLLASLRQGGLVLVMRHASSPRDVPIQATADPANTTLERQLDEAGRTGATAMGDAIRRLKIPIGEVISSGTFRALQTVRLAKLGDATVVPELGDGGRSMQGGTAAQAAWLQKRVTQTPKSGNTLLVTHMPNVAGAFPDWGSVADGEMVVVRPGATPAVLGRITIEEWPRLK